MCRLENGDARRIVDVRAGSDADSADGRGERVGNVVAVQVERRDHVVFGGARQDLLQERVADAVLDDDRAAGLGIPELAPGALVDERRTVFALSELVAPVAERAFGELLDVALVNERHRLAVVVDRVLDRRADEALGAFERDGLDADRGSLGEADFLYPHLAEEERLYLLDFGRPVHPFDTGVDVFGIFAEDHHVGKLGALNGGGNALEVSDGP